MLYLQSATYDPSALVLTVRFTSPSGARRETYQYRGVDPELAERFRRARPNVHALIEEVIAPTHEVRRAGAATWEAPGPCPALTEPADPTDA